MKKQNIMPAVVLGTICLIAALLLSVVNMFTAPIINEAQDRAANEALLVVLPGGSNFEELEIDGEYPKVIKQGYKADGGYVFRAEVTGKNPGLVVMVGIDESGKIVATKVIGDKESPGYANKVASEIEGSEGAYSGMTLDSFETHIVSSASYTSGAYGEAVKAALQAYAIANDVEVDVRTPEQILADNCNAALGTEGLVFERLFLVESLEGVDAVYVPKDNSGRVYRVGENYVGVKADGTISNIGSVDEAVITEAENKLSSSKLTEITDIPDGISKTTVKKIFVTDSGNYVFELVAKGYQVLFDYGNGTVINIKLSISADGKIIDCLTLSHDETEGVGDVCATDEYYSQYIGATNEDIVITVKYPDAHADQIAPDNTDIGAIASASLTTHGYQKAVKTAFEAYEILTGGVAND